MDLANFLLDRKILLLGNFVLNSGKVSPYYLDMRSLPSYLEFFDVVEKAVEAIKGIEFDMIVGVATGGVPFASFLACKMRKPMGYVRPEKKGHGTDRLVEGYVEGRKVLVVDDVSTTGGSLVSAVNKVRESGGIVENAIVIIDRTEGAWEKLREIGVTLVSVFTINQILESLLSSDKIKEGERKAIKEYLENNLR
ncbi:orotate phosphoribosyltransferase [Sulfuracidifex metallicus]|jgi:orotate phosphoribosyltransferase|uniref:Orotate phosphoribosyltransferase n=1 Tax=Sulfuracidifex metallicus DSM 6482 = JCM 9184 TaxID=523847 RepID=A0A6A9QLU7_SULME|nr:orotate phosphoribosyltransferase [Sulfuracidifex metallicus]MUN28161.1 orotate phosphoribosyltransferase [Sulfuracidifex metallicus DSM 6482 = JCM 9184]WOE51304.1 orotate phosphoribosyltransferase [Sulfuracidifex metallicus DSM 6482 = JCM 9184]